ncbi:MAG: hypothetical protein BWY42_01185 [Candidatus Omnitrophica bacterium ADurb.Bin277]|nr:MAG: hypothetical protein BWY42_01185 [Candidatus Omnitrophica bacterium ADurb.Bin277]
MGYLFPDRRIKKPFGMLPDSIGFTADEALRMTDRPWMIDRQMVRHKIDDEPHPHSVQFHFQLKKLFGRSQVGVQHIVVNSIGRTFHILRSPFAEDKIVGMPQTGLPQGMITGPGTPHPNSHEPKILKPLLGKSAPLFARDGGEAQLASVFFGHAGYKIKRVDFQ